MKKIALLLTGQLRTYDFCKHIVKSTLLDKYDVDVFLAISTPATAEEVADVCEFYKPVGTYVAPMPECCVDEYLQLINQVDFFKCASVANNSPYLNSSREEQMEFLKRMLQQCFILNEAYKLLQHHIQTTGIVYDLIIRFRFDHIYMSTICSSITTAFNYNASGHIICGSPGSDLYDRSIKSMQNISRTATLILDDVKPDAIYVSGSGSSSCLSGQTSRKWCNDHNFIHSHNLIQIMGSYFDALPSLLNSMFTPDEYPAGPTHEVFLYKYFEDNNLTIRHSLVNQVKLVTHHDRNTT